VIPVTILTNTNVAPPLVEIIVYHNWGPQIKWLSFVMW